MPEESIAAYINNTVAFVIFILVCMIVFALIFLVLAAIRKKILIRNQKSSRVDIDVDNRGSGFNKTGTEVLSQTMSASDPFIRKNIAFLGTVFVFIILSAIK